MLSSNTNTCDNDVFQIILKKHEHLLFWKYFDNEFEIGL